MTTTLCIVFVFFVAWISFFIGRIYGVKEGANMAVEAFQISSEVHLKSESARMEIIRQAFKDGLYELNQSDQVRQGVSERE